MMAVEMEEAINIFTAPLACSEVCMKLTNITDMILSASNEMINVSKLVLSSSSSDAEPMNSIWVMPISSSSCSINANRTISKISSNSRMELFSSNPLSGTPIFWSVI